MLNMSLDLLTFQEQRQQELLAASENLSQRLSSLGFERLNWSDLWQDPAHYLGRLASPSGSRALKLFVRPKLIPGPQGWAEDLSSFFLL